jgi:hypothetical protein
LQHPPLLAFSISEQGLSPRMSTPRLPLQSKHPQHNFVHDAPAPTAGGGVSARWFLRLRFLSILTVHDAIVVHVTTTTTVGEC